MVRRGSVLKMYLRSFEKKNSCFPLELDTYLRVDICAIRCWLCVDIYTLFVAGVRVTRRRAAQELLRVHAQRGPQRAEHARRVRG